MDTSRWYVRKYVRIACQGGGWLEEGGFPDVFFAVRFPFFMELPSTNNNEALNRFYEPLSIIMNHDEPQSSTTSSSPQSLIFSCLLHALLLAMPMWLFALSNLLCQIWNHDPTGFGPWITPKSLMHSLHSLQVFCIEMAMLASSSDTLRFLGCSYGPSHTSYKYE